MVRTGLLYLALAGACAAQPASRVRVTLVRRTPSTRRSFTSSDIDCSRVDFSFLFIPGKTRIDFGAIK